MSSYDDYLAAKQKFVADNKPDIDYVNENDIPQHVLWKKTAADTFKDETATFEEIGGKFYFTEAMVNKLMHLAYLSGSKKFDEKSYEQGWSDAYNDVADKLGFHYSGD